MAPAAERLMVSETGIIGTASDRRKPSRFAKLIKAMK
jgi:hypothetical protein